MKNINIFKMYTLKDVENKTSIDEDKLRAFLEGRKDIGKKIGNTYFIRGREILLIERDINKGTDEKKITE